MIKLKTTEKAVRLIEAENTIVIETEKKKRKEDIKKDFEKFFNVKVEKVRLYIKNNRKIAYVKLNKANLAIDVATKYGMI